MLVASQNPCPCGYYGDTQKECTCSPSMRQRYQDRISGPLLDRIDLRISVPRLPADDLLKVAPGESSDVIRSRIVLARRRATERQGSPNAYLAGQALRQHIALSPAAETLTQAVIKKMGLSGRGFDRLLRVSRTIADLANEAAVTESHVAEAVSYRQ
jgi:magnesium chelatase family protein